MKARILFLFFLVWAVLPKPGALAACGQITTWEEADGSVYPLESEGLSVGFRNDATIFSGAENAATHIGVNGQKQWTIGEKECTWRITISIRSYGTKEKAEYEDSRFSPPPAAIIYTEDPLTYYYGIGGMPPTYPTDEFVLRDTYLNNVIHIAGWQVTPLFENMMTPEALRPFFIGLLRNSRALINEKCGIVAENRPEIELSPSDQVLFNISIMKKMGFEIIIKDEDGIFDEDEKWTLDWATFRVSVNYKPMTVHFMKVVSGSSPSPLVGAPYSHKKLRLQFKPDPEEFVGKHNLFGLTKNGTHVIELQICDVGGLCASSSYSLFFGPFSIFRDDNWVKKEGFSFPAKSIKMSGGNLGFPAKVLTACVLQYKNEFMSLKGARWVPGIKAWTAPYSVGRDTHWEKPVALLLPMKDCFKWGPLTLYMITYDIKYNDLFFDFVDELYP